MTDVDHLQAIIKNRLKSIQYRTDLLDGFLAHTGLTLEPDTTCGDGERSEPAVTEGRG